MSEDKEKRTEEVKETKQEDVKDKWATEAQDELEDWIEEQGIQLRY